VGRLMDITRSVLTRVTTDENWFGTPLSFTPTIGDPFVIHGLAFVISEGVDENGLPIITEDSHIFFSETAITDLGYVVREGNKTLIKDWIVEFDHAVGHVKAKLSEVKPDNTLGHIKVQLTNYG